MNLNATPVFSLCHKNYWLLKLNKPLLKAVSLISVYLWLLHCWTPFQDIPSEMCASCLPLLRKNSRVKLKPCMNERKKTASKLEEKHRNDSFFSSKKKRCWNRLPYLLIWWWLSSIFSLFTPISLGKMNFHPNLTFAPHFSDECMVETWNHLSPYHEFNLLPSQLTSRVKKESSVLGCPRKLGSMVRISGL